jgi:hypothetical protein
MRLKFLGRDTGCLVPNLKTVVGKKGPFQTVAPGAVFECDAEDGAKLLSRFNMKPNKTTGKVYAPKFEEVGSKQPKTKQTTAVPPIT